MAFYRKKSLQELIPWTPDIPMALVSISAADLIKGSPKQGDMLACNPEDVTDWWLVEAQFFNDSYEWFSDL
jgi:hypothetical protein